MCVSLCVCVCIRRGAGGDCCNKHDNAFLHRMQNISITCWVRLLKTNPPPLKKVLHESVVAFLGVVFSVKFSLLFINLDRWHWNGFLSHTVGLGREMAMQRAGAEISNIPLRHPLLLSSPLPSDLPICTPLLLLIFWSGWKPAREPVHTTQSQLSTRLECHLW